MKLKHKIYLRINITAIIFIIVSFISVTLAWFAYSGLSEVNMDVNVKAWYIELKKGDQPAENEIDISLNDIYPGMDTVYETVNITNKGDSNAQINYNITSAKILNEVNYVVDDINITSSYVEDKLSHDYPFHINISLSNHFALIEDGKSTFTVSISWPLDSGDNNSDSYWGKKAYDYQSGNQGKSIQVKINLSAEQYIEEPASSDTTYYLGKMIYYDVILNKRCSQNDNSASCIKTHVIDVDNKLGDNNVTLLPDLNEDYYLGDESDTYFNYNTKFSSITNGWTVEFRKLTNKDILNIISTDVINSFLIRNNLSNSVIGNLGYQNRIDTELAKVISSNGYYSFDSIKYIYLVSNTCYWTQDTFGDNSFAISLNNENTYKLYGESKDTSCKIVPVIVAPKNKM